MNDQTGIQPLIGHVAYMKGYDMQHLDFSPLYKSTVGFDHLFNLLDNTGHVEKTATTYPPYNIQKFDENSYRISMAVAGFTDDEIDIEIKEQSLQVVGDKTPREDVEYLHQGIANRAFKRVFQLADHVEVTGAKLENGFLHIDLKREIPEKMKARKIAIERQDAPKTIQAE